MNDLEATLAIFDWSGHTAEAELNRARKLERAFRRKRLYDRSDLIGAIDAMDRAEFLTELAVYAARELAPMLDRERAADAQLAHNIRLALGDDETRLRQSCS